MENLNDFLKETEFCNFSDKSIKDLAEEIEKNCKSDRDFAVSAFYWVRDNILYRVGLWQRTASQTLLEKEGTCTNKANLLVALLRYKKIPAGYGIMKVKGQDYMGIVVVPMLRNNIAKTSTHVFVCINHSGKWISIDPSADKQLSESIGYFNEPARLVDWDGESDAMEKINPDHIIKNDFPVSSIDEIMKKKPRNARGVILKVGNLFIKFLRETKPKIQSDDEIEPLFKSWLKKNYFIYFLMFKISYFLKKLNGSISQR
jgi:hypothetical protein